jgi:hypothetical protein
MGGVQGSLRDSRSNGDREEGSEIRLAIREAYFAE